MNRRRLFLGATGVLVVSLTVADAGLVGGLVPTDPVVSLLGNDYLFAAVLGLAALGLGAVVADRGAGVDQTRMPDPEAATTVPAPGDEFAETLGRWRLAVPFLGRELGRQVRERLRVTAVEAVRRSRGCDAAGARRRVANGTWTDDPHAAAFLADGRGPSLGARVEATLRGDSWFVHAARRTAAAIADLEGKEDDRTPPSTVPEPDAAPTAGNANARGRPAGAAATPAGSEPVADGRGSRDGRDGRGVGP